MLLNGSDGCDIILDIGGVGNLLADDNREGVRAAGDRTNSTALRCVDLNINGYIRGELLNGGFVACGTVRFL